MVFKFWSSRSLIIPVKYLMTFIIETAHQAEQIFLCPQFQYFPVLILKLY